MLEKLKCKKCGTEFIPTKEPWMGNPNYTKPPKLKCPKCGHEVQEDTFDKKL